MSNIPEYYDAVTFQKLEYPKFQNHKFILVVIERDGKKIQTIVKNIVDFGNKYNRMYRSLVDYSEINAADLKNHHSYIQYDMVNDVVSNVKIIDRDN